MREEQFLRDHLYLTLDALDVASGSWAPDELVRAAPRIVLDEVQREPDRSLRSSAPSTRTGRAFRGDSVLAARADLLRNTEGLRDFRGARDLRHAASPSPLRRERLGAGTAGIWSSLVEAPPREWYAVSRESGCALPPADWKAEARARRLADPSVRGWPTPLYAKSGSTGSCARISNGICRSSRRSDNLLDFRRGVRGRGAAPSGTCSTRRSSAATRRFRVRPCIAISISWRPPSQLVRLKTVRREPNETPRSRRRSSTGATRGSRCTWPGAATRRARVSETLRSRGPAAAWRDAQDPTPGGALLADGDGSGGGLRDRASGAARPGRGEGGSAILRTGTSARSSAFPGGVSGRGSQQGKFHDGADTQWLSDRILGALPWHRIV